MENKSLTMRYLYNNEIVDNPANIPPTADVICLFSQEDDTVVFATTVKGGRLEAIDCFDTLSEGREKATEILRLAENMGVLPENADGLSIYIHRDPKDFDLGHALPEDKTVVAKEQFTYSASESDRLNPLQQHTNRFVVEVLSAVPEGVIVKRGFFLMPTKNCWLTNTPFTHSTNINSSTSVFYF